MSELRKDPILERWVIIAEERAKRPAAFVYDDPPTSGEPCPFCEGQEAETLPEVAAVRKPETSADRPGWRVRVVPNRYPALDSDLEPSFEEQGMYRRMAGSGVHEVIVEGATHTKSVTELPATIMYESLGMYRQRLSALSKEHFLRSAVVIKNVGRPAGASIEHSHSQLIATPILPMRLAAELEAGERWHAEYGRCIWCMMLSEELKLGRRVILEGAEIVAFCPFAPRFPFETWLMPARHESNFEATSDACLQELATALQSVLSGIERILSQPPYNYVLHSGPFGCREHSHYHWRLEILPRLTRAAGFEQATGLYINSMTPEDAAKALRSWLSETQDQERNPINRRKMP